MASALGTLHYFDNNLEVHHVVVGAYANNVFVLRCKHTGDAVLIDAADEHDLLLELCKARGVRRELETQGLRDGVTARKALGYAQVLSAFDGEFTLEEAPERTMIATRQFARRQDSWFGRDSTILWHDANSLTAQDVVALQA